MDLVAEKILDAIEQCKKAGPGYRLDLRFSYDLLHKLNLKSLDFQTLEKSPWKGIRVISEQEPMRGHVLIRVENLCYIPDELIETFCQLTGIHTYTFTTPDNPDAVKYFFYPDYEQDQCF